MCSLKGGGIYWPRIEVLGTPVTPTSYMVYNLDFLPLSPRQSEMSAIQACILMGDSLLDCFLQQSGVLGYMVGNSVAR